MIKNKKKHISKIIIRIITFITSYSFTSQNNNIQQEEQEEAEDKSIFIPFHKTSKQNVNKTFNLFIPLFNLNLEVNQKLIIENLNPTKKEKKDWKKYLKKKDFSLKKEIYNINKIVFKIYKNVFHHMIETQGEALVFKKILSFILKQKNKEMNFHNRILNNALNRIPLEFMPFAITLGKEEMQNLYNKKINEETKKKMNEYFEKFIISLYKISKAIAMSHNQPKIFQYKKKFTKETYLAILESGISIQELYNFIDNLTNSIQGKKFEKLPPETIEKTCTEIIIKENNLSHSNNDFI